MASRTCWRCHVKATHQFFEETMADRYGIFWSAARCDECGALSIATTPSLIRYESDAFLALRQGNVGAWIPATAAGKEFPAAPGHIAEAANEAHRCYSIDAYRGAAILARAVIEAIAKDHQCTEGNLVRKIKDMAALGLFRAKIADLAHQVRLIGNEVAHGDLDTVVSDEDAADALSIMDLILTEIYEHDALLLRVKQRRPGDTAAADA